MWVGANDWPVPDVFSRLVDLSSEAATLRTCRAGNAAFSKDASLGVNATGCGLILAFRVVTQHSVVTSTVRRLAYHEGRRSSCGTTGL